MSRAVVTPPTAATHGAHPRGASFAVSGLVALGGVSALSWEVLWQLEASLSLGVSAVGTALTLATMMAGITAGSLIAGHRLRGVAPQKGLRLYGLLELAIGISGAAMLPGFAMLEVLDGALYPATPALAPAIHLLGIALLLGPPTFAMGASIPVFQLIARSHGVPVSRLYALNTAGAAVGVLAISFVGLPSFGVRTTCALVASLNFLVFAVSRTRSAQVGAAGERDSSSPVSATPWRPHAPPRLSWGAARWVVLGTGFVTFGLELAWFRSLRAAFQSTTDSFAIILASVLVPLALGARAVPAIRRRDISPGPFLALSCVAILLATPLVERMDLFTGIGGQLQGWVLALPGVEPGDWLARSAGSYWAIATTRLVLALGILGPAMFLLGVALPWCLEEFPEPSQSGRLYALNTLGAVGGSLSAAWVWLPTLGFARTAWLLGGITGVLALRLNSGRRRWAVLLAASLAGWVAASLSSSPGRDRIPRRADLAGHHILAFDEGPDSTASVVESPRGVRFLMIDGYIATSEWLGAHYMQWMGRLPMMLHPAPETSLVICFGTGQTADALREEEPRSLDVVELNDAVLRMALHFESNHGVLEDPRVRAHAMDGRAWLRRTRDRYDVITLEPMPPTFAGVNALYSLEFYELMAEGLRPGGVVAQWLPFHLLQPLHAAAVVATFRAVFSDSVLWIDPLSGTGILLGRQPGPGPGLGEAWPGLDRRRRPRTLEDRFIRRGLTLDSAALGRYAALGQIITDDNQFLAYGLMPGKFWSRNLAPMQEINRDIVAKLAGRPIFRLSRDQLRSPRPESVSPGADRPRALPAR